MRVRSLSHQQLPKLKNFKWLMCISPVITILSLALLLWTYRSDRTFQFQIQYFQPTAEPRIPVQPRVTRQCGPGRIAPPEPKIHFVALNRTKTVLVSAYQEHRTGQDEIRVLAVVLRSETVAYYCLLCCHDQLHISEGVRDIHSDHFEFPYGTADIMCPVPSGCKTPSRIAVTTAINSEDDFDQEFLEVKNQKAKLDSFPYNFTVCLSTMFDFTNVLQLVQGLEVLQLLGVDRVVVYKTSTSPETQRVLDYYTHKGLVDVIPWTISRFVNVSRSFFPSQGDPGELHYFGQIPALNDCVYRYMYRSRYVALHDIDELILPQSLNSWSELLPLLEQQHGPDRCYMFENNVFPTTVSPPPPASQTLPPQSHYQHVPGVNILAHLYCEPIIPETFNWNFKIIVNPRAVFVTSVHGVLNSQNGCSWVDRNTARMYHTRSPRQPTLTPDQLIYDDRLLRYSGQFTPRVNTVLKESGFLPEDSLL